MRGDSDGSRRTERAARLLSFLLVASASRPDANPPIQQFDRKASASALFLFPLRRSIIVFDDGVRAVSPTGGFRVPLTLVILVLDSFRVAGNFLLLGRCPRGYERLGVGRERLRKHAIDLIGPAAVVLDDLIGDIGHGISLSVGGLILITP
jgi:hypothetical protein